MSRQSHLRRRESAMAYAPVSDNLCTHPKVLALGRDFDALSIWVVGLSWVTANETDGVITPDAVTFLCPLVQKRTKVRWIDALIRVGLWEELPEQLGGGWFYHDFLDWQKPRNELAALRSKRQVAGALGGRRTAQANAAARARVPAQVGALPSSPLLSSLLPSSPCGASPNEANVAHA